LSVRTKRWAAAALTTLAVTAGVSALTPGVAHAASYNGACGSGYGAIDHLNVSGGTVWLTYNASTGKNCVVTVRNNPGARLFMNAVISHAGTSTWDDADPGQFTTYAGPVYVHAPHSCIDWGGVIDDSANFQWNSHCS
jgi:hypothetical protein